MRYFLTIGLMVCALSINPITVRAQAQHEEQMPMRKTDSQIMQEMEGLPYNWQNMSQDQKNEYSKKMIEDRFIITTQNFKVIETGLGSKICTLNTVLMNNSSRDIRKIHVNYKWDDTSTFTTFENIPAASVFVGQLSMSGSVCSRIMNGADYEVTTCEADGLTEDQCRLRVFEIK